MKTNLIGISGKIGSGKDTVGEIIRFLWDIKNTENGQALTVEDFIEAPSDADSSNPYQIKKFADKLKDIACLLIGCTREQLEDREFKEKELGEEWWYCKKRILRDVVELVDYKDAEDGLEVVKLTPRKLLQLLGTEAGRQILHPNIWVNALFADYDKCLEFIVQNELSKLKDKSLMGGFSPNRNSFELPNWIITDCRFPNEAQAIKDRGGIVIRVNRNASELERCLRDPVYFVENYVKVNGNKINLRDADKSFILKYFTHKEEHTSETALDDYEFDHVVENDGSIEELVQKIKQLNLV